MIAAVAHHLAHREEVAGVVELLDELELLFELSAHGLGHAFRVAEARAVEVIGLGDAKIISADVAELKEAWQEPLRW